MRGAEGELDDLEAALDVALRVGGDRLAMLGRQEARQRIHLLLHELEELHQDAGPLLRLNSAHSR